MTEMVRRGERILYPFIYVGFDVLLYHSWKNDVDSLSGALRMFLIPENIGMYQYSSMLVTKVRWALSSYLFIFDSTQRWHLGRQRFLDSSIHWCIHQNLEESSCLQYWQQQWFIMDTKTYIPIFLCEKYDLWCQLCSTELHVSVFGPSIVCPLFSRCLPWSAQ